MRTDLPGIDEMAQPLSATAGLPLSALVLRRESRLGVGEAARGRYEYPVFLRSDQSLRGVADGIDAFLLDVALPASYSRGRAALHANGDYLLIALPSFPVSTGPTCVVRSSRRRIERFTSLTNANEKLKGEKRERKYSRVANYENCR